MSPKSSFWINRSKDLMFHLETEPKNGKKQLLKLKIYVNYHRKRYRCHKESSIVGRLTTNPSRTNTK